MKTLRKLAAIFCALGMLVPSVAMATFGSTFGHKSIVRISWTYYSTSAWPDGGTGASAACWGSVYTINTNTNDFPCNAQIGWSPYPARPIPGGHVTVKSLSCSNPFGLGSNQWADGSSALSFQAMTKDTTQTNAALALGDPLVIPSTPVGNERLSNYVFTQTINETMVEDWGRVIAISNPVSTQSTAISTSGWHCQILLEVSS